MGRQHQVHAEASSPLRDADQRAEEVGQLGRQRRELVDHDDEPRRCGALVSLQALAMAKLSFEGTKGVLAQLLIEVGHEADAVR